VAQMAKVLEMPLEVLQVYAGRLTEEKERR
jgi:hypothetical protein